MQESVLSTQNSLLGDIGGHLLETRRPVSLVLSFLTSQSSKEEGWRIAASDLEVSRKES